MTYGLAIIGTGTISAVYADALALLPDARLTAVTDVDAGAARSFAAERGCPAEPTVDALVARPDVDVVCVCVPSGLHADIGVRAAKAGKHLIIEKPVDVTLDAADRLLAAVREAGVALTVMSQHRFDPGVLELRRLVDAGALGRLLIGEAHTKWHRTQGYYDKAAWRGTWAMDGGSLLNQGVHYVDLLRWFMGPVAEVSAVTATQAHDIEVEDTALAVIRFASGAVGMLSSTTAAYPGFPQRLEITGTRGTVIIEDGEIVQRALAAEQDAAEQDMAEPPDDAAPADQATARDGAGDGIRPSAAVDPGALDPAFHAAQIAGFLRAIAEGTEPPVTGENGRDALEIVCAVYESSRTGRAVTLTP